MATGGYSASRRVYRKAVNRGNVEEGEEESKYDVEESIREIEEYVRFVNKNTEFFSTANPNELLNELAGYFEEKGYKFDIAKDKYKVKVAMIEGNDSIEMTVKILKATPEKYCVEFNRTSGDQLLFFN